MLGTFYTLKALVEEWHSRIGGATVEDVFSQEAGELVLALSGGEGDSEGQGQAVRLRLRRPLLYMFRTDRVGRARRNVATLFEEAFGRRIRTVRIATRDRMVFFDLDGGLYIQALLFGARANAFLVEGGASREEGASGAVVLEAFSDSEEHVGKEPPAPRPAPMPDTFEQFEERWRSGRNTLAQAVASAMTLFGRTLADEVVCRAGVEKETPEACTEADRWQLFETARQLQEDLQTPAPRIYSKGWEAGTFSLIELRHLNRAHAEPIDVESFESVDEAVRVYVRRRLAERRYRELYDPLEKALTDAKERLDRTAARIEETLEGESRADRYEHYGHLLMAHQGQVEAGADEVMLSDLFAGGDSVRIPLEKDLSAVENAERYYEKAGRARTAHEREKERRDEVKERAAQVARLLDGLRRADTLKKLRRFRKEEAGALTAFTEGRDTETESLPFRRFSLAKGYEVWAGKNARQNHDLTFHRAQKYDRWMHARGVPGAHVVLRLPNRNAEPDKRVLQQAASIAAYYSKARGSKLVPVMVTERKYVTSPSGAPPGAVRVEREEVLLVEPRLPG